MAKNTEQENLSTPGWFGKLPFLGDFASRRLPQNFLSSWDNWLQRGMVASRAQLGERWLDTYLHSPIWHFVLWPGVAGDDAWVGILMPSVDAVGRYFPLTIAAQIARPANNLAELIGSPALQHWYTALEQLALATLDIHFSIDDLEQGLPTNPLPSAPSINTQNTAVNILRDWLENKNGAQTIMQLSSTQHLPSLISTTAIQLLNTAAYGRSLWWHHSADSETPIYGFVGLPPDDCFSDLLQGKLLAIS